MTAQLTRPVLEAPAAGSVRPTPRGRRLVSFAAVAAEDPGVSVAIERHICAHLEELDHTHV